MMIYIEPLDDGWLVAFAMEDDVFKILVPDGGPIVRTDQDFTCSLYILPQVFYGTFGGRVKEILEVMDANL